MSMRSVSPKVYNKDYYLKDCSGYKEYSNGEIEPRIEKIIKNIKLKPGLKVLDLGCGRGEVSLWAAREGCKVVGIDYSEDAISLASKLLQKNKKLKSKVNFKMMNVKKLDFHDSTFDVVISLEVLEHLYNEEKDIFFSEIKRVLKKGGKLYLNTEPNLLFNDIGYKYFSYPLGRFLINVNNYLFSNNYPNLVSWRKVRSASHRVMHVGEENYFSLFKRLRKFNFVFSIKSLNYVYSKPIISWKDKLFNTFVFLIPLSNYFPFNILFGQDFFVIAEK